MTRPVAPILFALLALAWPGLAPAGPPGPAIAEDQPLDGPSIPTEASKPPKVTEWPGAQRVRLTRKGPQAAGCHALLVREWMRLRCEGDVFALSLLGGTPEGIAFWIGQANGTPFGEVLLPLRRGDRRVFQLWAPGKDADGAFVAKPMLVVQESWMAGQETPTVTAW